MCTKISLLGLSLKRKCWFKRESLFRDNGYFKDMGANPTVYDP
jgi:hypothetical protein